MRIFALLLATCTAAWAADEFTVYELLPPNTHQFDIIYDVSTSHEGAGYLFNPIRAGSIATKERVIDLATGKPLEFEVVGGKVAKESGLVESSTLDNSQFIRVKLLRAVPKGAETRVRIFKTYTDPPSYYEKDGGLVFDRSLTIKRNLIVLPRGYELTGSTSPGIVSTESDGRVRISFLNDRDDTLPVKITGRRLP